MSTMTAPSQAERAQARITLALDEVRLMTPHQLDEGLLMIAYVLPHRDGLEEYTLTRVQDIILEEIARRITSHPPRRIRRP